MSIQDNKSLPVGDNSPVADGASFIPLTLVKFFQTFLTLDEEMLKEFIFAEYDGEKYTAFLQFECSDLRDCIISDVRIFYGEEGKIVFKPPNATSVKCTTYWDEDSEGRKYRVLTFKKSFTEDEVRKDEELKVFFELS